MLECTKKDLKLKIINPNNYKEKARNKKFFDKALRTTFLNTYSKGIYINMMRMKLDHLFSICKKDLLTTKEY